MNVLVLLKQTFDTEEKVVIKDGKVIEDGVELVINPYDEYAVEEAVKLREMYGAEVTAVTVGASQAEKALRTALAMGVDKAVMVVSEDESADEYTVSKILANVAKRDSYDIVLSGYMAVDNGSAQIGPRVAEELGIPHVSGATAIEIEGMTVKVEKDVEGETELIESSLPILITAQQGLNQPRYPSLPGIMRAKKKPLERLTVKDLKMNFEEIQARTEVVDQFLPPKKEGGKVLRGDLRDQVKELVQLLHKDMKVNKAKM